MASAGCVGPSRYFLSFRKLVFIDFYPLVKAGFHCVPGWVFHFRFLLWWPYKNGCLCHFSATFIFRTFLTFLTFPFRSFLTLLCELYEKKQTSEDAKRTRTTHQRQRRTQQARWNAPSRCWKQRHSHRPIRTKTKTRNEIISAIPMDNKENFLFYHVPRWFLVRQKKSRHGVAFGCKHGLRAI